MLFPSDLSDAQKSLLRLIAKKPLYATSRGFRSPFVFTPIDRRTLACVIGQKLAAPRVEGEHALIQLTAEGRDMVGRLSR